MSQGAAILAVAADDEALRRVDEELRRRYDRDYEIVCKKRPDEGVRALDRMQAEGAPLALVLADIACTELLERVRRLYPRAKRGLLISWGAWGDETTANAIREAMAHGRIDYYVLEPWTSPDEYFHRTISELLTEWQRSDPSVRREVTLVADPHEPRTHELRNLLARSGVPHAFHATDTGEGKRLLREKGRTGATHPVVILRDQAVLDDPSYTELASGYRVPTELVRSEFDLVVVGAGPAGLAAAVYASSEGIDALVVEPASIGGQAGSSSRIRNYLGFPRGLSGAELAQRAYQQAWVFGASFLLTKEVTRLREDEGRHILAISAGDAETEVRARTVVLAMGITYRRLGIPALERLEGRGVFYGTSPTDAQPFAGEHVLVVGGANSAGQAAVHLARYAAGVTLVVRGKSLGATMSRYLEDEIELRENIDVRAETEVVDASGDERLERVTLRDASGGAESVPADGLFVLIGAHPNTDWLPDHLERDERGYIVTGEDLGDSWALERSPLMFETSIPGVFAVGDVRSRSVKRVAAAAGEGSVVIQQVHRYLESLDPRVAAET